MLRKNPLQPPLPFSPDPATGAQIPQPLPGTHDAFVSAEDFDRTGILTGVDPCESRYWWLPELFACEGADGPQTASVQGGRACDCRSSHKPVG